MIKKIVTLVAISLLLFSCKEPQPRYPVSHSSGTFLKESAARNKKLVLSEEQLLNSVMNKNPQNQYIASQKGYWYTYVNKTQTETAFPQKGDVAFFDYEIKDLNGNIIYSQEELQPQSYVVDKQNIITGLADGLKLMHKNETVTFYFPSHMAYGYHGDDNKIKTNQPIICTVTLKNFKKLPPKQKTVIKDTIN